MQRTRQTSFKIRKSKGFGIFFHLRHEPMRMRGRDISIVSRFKAYMQRRRKRRRRKETLTSPMYLAARRTRVTVGAGFQVRNPPHPALVMGFSEAPMVTLGRTVLWYSLQSSSVQCNHLHQSYHRQTHFLEPPVPFRLGSFPFGPYLVFFILANEALGL
jgi:hypothetical protein